MGKNINAATSATSPAAQQATALGRCAQAARMAKRDSAQPRQSSSSEHCQSDGPAAVARLTRLYGDGASTSRAELSRRNQVSQPRQWSSPPSWLQGSRPVPPQRLQRSGSRQPGEDLSALCVHGFPFGCYNFRIYSRGLSRFLQPRKWDAPRGRGPISLLSGSVSWKLGDVSSSPTPLNLRTLSAPRHGIWAGLRCRHGALHHVAEVHPGSGFPRGCRGRRHWPAVVAGFGGRK